jgi:anthranilate/para-aminobenzoate synthase component I
VIVIEKQFPLTILECLGADQLAIKSIKNHGFLAFLDFQAEIILDSEKTDIGIESLSSPCESMDLTFSGWVGFFGYEFLGTHLGINLSAKRDINVPDGWFGRPNTIIHFLNEKTKIESCQPERANKIAQLIEGSEIQNFDNVNFSTRSRKCNLEFSEYEKIFNQARESILDGES